MKVLLIGADQAVREERRKLLESAGYEAFAISSSDADPYMADPDIGCLVLGNSVGESMAELLASQFMASRENRLVVRVVEEPAATKYPYAHIVVSPRTPAALLAAVKAVAIRLSQKTF
jgi:hypothetical protein